MFGRVPTTESTTLRRTAGAYVASAGDNPTIERALVDALPIPPPEMRRLVGDPDPRSFDNPGGSLVYPEFKPEQYESVLDFGCGCGRVARRLIQQRPQPKRYLGVDIHRGMLKWCRENLQPLAPQFEFAHLDVFSAGLNPGPGKPLCMPLPTADGEFTFFEACSVFTHLVQSQAGYFLGEAARVLRPSGIVNATWFLFDKGELPMLRDVQNALYTNELDLSSAVIFDKQWVRRTAEQSGLVIVAVVPPEIRNFHWRVVMSKDPQATAVEFPVDDAPLGSAIAPALPKGASDLGAGDD
jgi:SAM-dependent methyltransferase